MKKQDLEEKNCGLLCQVFLVRVRTAILSELSCSFINNIKDKL